jgi:putative endonuclease
MSLLPQFPRLRLNNPKGQHYENQALHFLQAQGLTLITQNFRCRSGEIDLIMRDAHCLVFIEVRYRASLSHGGAAASVTREKQRKLLQTARYFLQQQGWNETNEACRFDVMAFDGSEECQWYQNAIQGT